MYTVDFQKEYKFNYGTVDAFLTIIVVKDNDGFPYVFQERRLDGRYYYTRDEFWVESWSGAPITEKLTVEQLMCEDDLPSDLFWNHP